ncbi:Tellurium resistance [Yinghuangia sp. ASG 101]|uniref:Tellurium resistance n=1 Tax=Yinghuangia sp. ASG 101 TaxID=2896848 RepID=UPI001E5E2699|nr:Tellurium resistance [Yinghuangia sp. ASG 101]UGQ14076.1 Tellurium resistance [Yinghuangia sp. ASG 101]
MPLFGRQQGLVGEPEAGGHKVTLTRSTPEVSLTQQGSATGTLRVNLNWNQSYEEAPGKPRGGLFRPMEVQAPPLPQKIDLDLGCMWELVDGSKGVVQALGNLYGDFNQAPYIRLDHDDRTGSASGETMFINLDQVRLFRRLLIFVYIYDGTPAFDHANGVVSLFPNAGRPIDVRLDERSAGARTCAVALVENRDDDLTVRRVVRYIDGFQAELDRAFGWGLVWARGYK